MECNQPNWIANFVGPPDDGRTLYKLAGPFSRPGAGQQWRSHWVPLYRQFRGTRREPQCGVLMWLPLDPDSLSFEEGSSRNVRGVGHQGTGDVELTIRNLHDMQNARLLI